MFRNFVKNGGTSPFPLFFELFRNVPEKSRLNFLGSGGESLIKSEKTSTCSMFEINMERFGSSWFSVTHPQDQK
jgi:hypothetical protein